MLALILEDEALIGLELEAEFTEAGFAVTWLRSCAEAAHWVAGNTPDVAVLDITLTDGSCEAVATELAGRGVPLLVHSGEGAPARHSVFANAKWMGKPAPMTDVVSVASQLAQRRERP